MSSKTVTTATCDTCGKEEAFKGSHDRSIPSYWAHTVLRGPDEYGGTPIYTLDLCPDCQIKALISLGKGKDK